MGSSRFFVANLPLNTTEQQLKEIFHEYGTVERVELKTKDNAFEPGSVKTIAFVTLQLHPIDVNNCVDALNWQKINGASIKVSVAKESFLERLKREREEAEKGKDDDNQFAWSEDKEKTQLPHSVENTRKTFTEEDLKALENDEDLVISKKRASSSLHNGRIVIQSCDTTPLHIIEGTKKKNKKPDGSETRSEQKRKESQNKMLKQYKEKKSVIQLALSRQDAPTANKIKFSDAEEEDEPSEKPRDSSYKSTTNIFGSDDEDNDEKTNVKLQLKPELFGKKGSQLVEMQSKQSLDPRFRIDAKFIDDDDVNDHTEAASTENETTDNGVSERTWQMGILEQVVGTKFDVTDSALKTAHKKRMLRYDPSNEDHQKLLRTTNKNASVIDDPDAAKTTGKSKHKNRQAENEELTIEDATPEVSKEVFYVVTDTLAESLKTRGDGFSLLNMFGSGQVQEKRSDDLKKVSDAKILVKSHDKNSLNPFKYDSSTDEEGENEPKQNIQKAKKEKQQSKIIMESFFIPRNDARLKEGAKFFRYEKKDAPEEDYEAVRNRLKILIRSKINKTKKNLVAKSGGGKIGHQRRIKVRH